MSQIQLGSYVNYKQNVYLVTALRANAQYLRLYSPIKKSVQVKASAVTLNNKYKPARLMECYQKEYLVTSQDVVIDLETNTVSETITNLKTL